MDKHDERRKKVQAMTDSQFRDFVFEQTRIYEEQFKEHRELLAQNTALTVEIAASTKGLVEIFNGAKTGATVFKWIGRNLRAFIKFIYPFVLLGGAIAAIMHGKFPKLGD
jgi:hypothetical protein